MFALVDKLQRSFIDWNSLICVSPNVATKGETNQGKHLHFPNSSLPQPVVDEYCPSKQRINSYQRKIENQIKSSVLNHSTVQGNA